MRAIVLERFGGREVLELKEIERPGPGEVLVRVVCAGTNPVDAKLRQNADWAGLTPPLVVGYARVGRGGGSGPRRHRVFARRRGLLHVAGCSTANAADVIVRTYTGAACQQWRIETAP